MPSYLHLIPPYHCREGLLKSLAKYIKIDVYGKCGNLSCAREEGDKCDKMLNDSYKFYLSFENSVCQVCIWNSVEGVSRRQLYFNITVGLRHREILQSSPVQRDPRGTERRRHVPGCPASLLHQRDGLQHHGGPGPLPPHGGPGRQVVRLLLLVERLLHCQGEDHIIINQTLTLVISTIY